MSVMHAILLLFYDRRLNNWFCHDHIIRTQADAIVLCDQSQSPTAQGFHMRRECICEGTIL